MNNPENIKKMKLGDILVKYGLISHEQLETALEAQKEFKTRLGRTLVQLGYVTEDDINWALSNQLDISYVHLTINMVDLIVARSIPREVLEFYQMIPIAQIGNELTLVMADPTDNQAIETVKNTIKAEISISLSSSSNILSIIRQVFKEESSHEIQHSDMEGIKSVDYKKEIKRLVTRDFDSGIFVYTVIFRAFEADASEIHIEPAQDMLRIRYKIDGIYHEYFSKPMSLYPSIMAQLEAIIKSGNTSGDGEGPFSINVMDQVIRINVHFAPTIYGKSVVLTLIPFIKDPVKLSDMKIDERITLELARAMKKNSGVIIVSSPGKIEITKTLYAMLREVSFTDKKVVTLEDFVTFRREGFVQMEYSSFGHSNDYEVLKMALGQNPDILMLTSDLSRESLTMLFNVALTGKLILIALPFQNVYTCFCYLTSLGIEPFAIAGVLQGIFSQRLSRALCFNCKQSVTVADFPFLADQLSHNVCYEKGKGCPECNFSGYMGQTLLCEYYLPSREDRMKILTSEGRDIFVPSNYKTIKERCREKVLDGILPVSEIINI